MQKDVVANRPYKRRADEREDGGKQADALEVVKRADANKLGEASGVAKTAAGAAKVRHRTQRSPSVLCL